MPGLPISKTQLDRLGDRLRDAVDPEPADVALLLSVLRAYRETLLTVMEMLTSLGHRPAARVKTTGTIVDKLRRERGSSLKTIHDLAGARVTVPGGLREQDDAVLSFRELCSAGAITAVTIDRRTDPRSGYRAVHLVAKPGGIPVEVQFRTELQHLWAQIFERLADNWGRGIRYGAEPEDNPGDRVAFKYRKLGVTSMLDLSRHIADHERSARAPVADELDRVLGTTGIDLTSDDVIVPEPLRGLRSAYVEHRERRRVASAVLREGLRTITREIELDGAMR